MRITNNTKLEITMQKNVYRKVEDFLNVWEYESQMTLKMFANLTDESLLQKAVPEGRAMGMLAWHIVLSVGEMMSKAGLKPDCPAEDAAVPKSAKEIYNTYKKASESVVSQIKSEWTDATLEEEDNLYGELWKKGATIHALITHQAHHRGQLTVYMRIAGLSVPGAYGPSREEWATFGMTAPE
jgi:uncharacterized damage-inducible protein DinB